LSEVHRAATRAGATRRSRLLAAAQRRSVLPERHKRERRWRLHSALGFIVIVLLVVRPFATAFALLNRSLSPREWLAAAWFGPKGFASIVYGTLMVQHGRGRNADEALHLASSASK
jgi:NhaP-type Na+/H+ or K+/H+ antiporter